jgi:hypothetical protein
MVLIQNIYIVGSTEILAMRKGQNNGKIHAEELRNLYCL